MIEQNTQTNFRSKLEHNLLRLVRFYTYNFFVDKGKYRLYAAAKKMCRELPRNETVGTRDGRRLAVDLSGGMGDAVFFFGKYEPFISSLAERLIKPGDVCLDVGANFGWYATLFSRLVGDSGVVHAFEPLPFVFTQLERNVELNRMKNVFLNNFGLSNEEKDVEIHLFADLPVGHASLAAKPAHDSRTLPIPVKPLNSYLSEKLIGQVDFVKVDTEGAELLFLKGATALFEQKKPPILLMEMALENSREFGYLPNDLIVFIREHGDYNFFAIDELADNISQIDGFKPEEIGANVLCIPKNADIEKIANLIVKK